MPTYQWAGVNLQGHLQKGKLFAFNSQDLERILFEHYEVALLRCSPVRSLLVRCWRTSDTLEFLKQLITLLNAGIFLGDALHILLNQATLDYERDFIGQIKDAVYKGSSMSEVFKQYPALNDKVIIAMLKSGEESGHLVPALELIAKHLEFSVIFSKKVRSAALIPLISFLFFVGITALVSMVILPQCALIFAENNYTLPCLARGLLSFGSGMHYVFSITGIMSIGIVMALLSCVYRKPWVRDIKDKILMKIPIISSLIVHTNFVYFFQSLALLLQGGTPLSRALVVAGQAARNSIMREFFVLLIQEVRNGHSLSAMVAQSKYARSNLVALLRVGEESGSMSAMITRCAGVCDETVTRTLTLFTVLLQPILMIILGIFVAALIAALYVPLFELAHVVSI
jgi:type II secretory pathway component PulF